MILTKCTPKPGVVLSQWQIIEQDPALPNAASGNILTKFNGSPRGLGRPCPNDFAASQWVTTDRDSIRQECPVLMDAAHRTPTE